jgi:hypothetical protein
MIAVPIALLAGLAILATFVASRPASAAPAERQLPPAQPKAPSPRRKRAEKALVRLIEAGNRTGNPVYFERASALAEKLGYVKTAEMTMRKADAIRREEALAKARSRARSKMRGDLFSAARKAYALGDEEAAREALLLARGR